MVGTIAWNNYRHLESYYAVSGSGMIMHTCNPRLHPDQLAYIINHADDEAILFDSTFAPLIKAIAPELNYRLTNTRLVSPISCGSCRLFIMTACLDTFAAKKASISPAVIRPSRLASASPSIPRIK